MTITHTIHRKGQWIVNGANQEVWDSTGFTRLDPVPNYAILGYTVRMHSNIVGHKLLEFSTLPNTELSQNISISIGSEGLGGTTGWQFNPMSQTYFSSMGDDSQQVRDWKVVANSIINGETRVTAPGIRVTSGNGIGQRGSFTKLTYPIGNSNWILEAGTWF